MRARRPRLPFAGLALFALAGAACNASPASGTATPPPGPTPAADFRSPHVQATLDHAARLLRTRGYTPDGTESRSFVVQHGTQVAPAPLRTGNCYVLVAAGSRAIGSLELAVYDGEGAKVAEPVGADAAHGHAALRFCPPQSGGYWATVRAVDGSGLVALRRFRGPTGLELRLDDLVRDAAEAP
jgi:hypothetical protein